MAHAANSPLPRQAAPSKIVDIFTRREIRSEDRPVYDAGRDDDEPDTVSARIETGVVVKACGLAAGALYGLVFENDRDGVANTYSILAEQASLSARQVIRLCQKMETAGVLTV